MKIIRTIWIVAIAIAFWPLIVFLEAAWFIWCIRCAKLMEKTITDAAKWWWDYLKAGIRMNKDFIVNGLNGY